MTDIVAEKLARLLPHAQIIDRWRQSGSDLQTARAFTLAQVEAFAEIVADDEGWEFIKEARHEDSWLNFDWPNGFDELLLCAPLCRLVDFECAQCPVGQRQNNYSCSHPDTLFGRVGLLLKAGDREGLRKQIEAIKSVLAP